MLPLPKKYLFGLFVASLAYTTIINQVNCAYVRKHYPENIPSNGHSLVCNSTLFSVDNYWYVNQVKNLVQRGKFTVDANMPFYEVRRTPVYPLFFGVHYLLFGEEKSYSVIRYTQTIILALSVIALFIAVYNFTGKTAVAWVAAGLYGLNPSVAVGAYYTLSESLSIEMVCFGLYCLSRCKLYGGKKQWFIAGLMFALAALSRASIIFMGASFFIALLIYSRWNWKKIIINGIAFSVGALCLFGPWTIRNYKVTKGDLVLLEKFYGDPMDYGMPNIYLKEWISCWTNPANFNMVYISNTMLSNLTGPQPVPEATLIDGYMNRMSKRAFIGNSKEDVRRMLESFYAYYESKTTRLDVAEIQQRESKVIGQIKRLKDNFIKASPLDYYVVTPALIMKSVVVQSNTSSLALLDDHQNNRLVYLWKGFFLILNIFTWISLIVFPFRNKTYREFYWIGVAFVAATMGIIIYSIRYIEARYSFPLLPVLFTFLAISMVEAWNYFRNKFSTAVPGK